MIFVFEASDGSVYNSPDSYILSKPNRTIEWGDKLRIYPVYQKGSRISFQRDHYQDIQPMFYHEGSCGSCGGTYWVPLNRQGKKEKETPGKKEQDWLDVLNNSETEIYRADNKRIVTLNLGPDHPKYFRSKEDLGWYVSNVYTPDQVYVFSEYDLDSN